MLSPLPKVRPGKMASDTSIMRFYFWSKTTKERERDFDDERELPLWKVLAWQYGFKLDSGGDADVIQ